MAAQDDYEIVNGSHSLCTVRLRRDAGGDGYGRRVGLSNAPGLHNGPRGEVSSLRNGPGSRRAF